MSFAAVVIGPLRVKTKSVVSAKQLMLTVKLKRIFFQCSYALEYIDGMPNSVDPDQTASRRSSLICVCTVCSDPSVAENFTVLSKIYKILILLSNLSAQPLIRLHRNIQGRLKSDCINAQND